MTNAEPLKFIAAALGNHARHASGMSSEIGGELVGDGAASSLTVSMANPLAEFSRGARRSVRAISTRCSSRQI